MAEQDLTPERLAEIKEAAIWAKRVATEDAERLQGSFTERYGNDVPLLCLAVRKAWGKTERAMQDEREECIADVCPLCVEGIPRKGRFHEQTKDSEVTICEAWKIHERAETEADSAEPANSLRGKAK